MTTTDADDQLKRRLANRSKRRQITDDENTYRKDKKVMHRFAEAKTRAAAEAAGIRKPDGEQKTLGGLA